MRFLLPNKLGQDVQVSWQAPRLIIMASTYISYDQYAVGLLPVGVELLRYQRYEDGTADSHVRWPQMA